MSRRTHGLVALLATATLVALLIGTLPAIALVLLAQLNSAIAPRLPWVSRV